MRDGGPLKRIAKLSENYRREILAQWLPHKDAYTRDWVDAFDFFLCHVYQQGRRDELSTRYYQRAIGAIREYFGDSSPARRRRFNEAWSNGWIPHDSAWSDFRVEDSPVCRQLREAAAGKRRDQEMVVDSLRYIRGLPDWNIVTYSCAEIAAGRTRIHFQDLDLVWQVGPKTASFYLRDLCTIYGIAPGPGEWEAMQPVDTWVRQIALRLGLIRPTDEGSAVVAKIVAACQSRGVHPADFNAGAWYLGTRSLDIALAAMGVSEEIDLA